MRRARALALGAVLAAAAIVAFAGWRAAGRGHGPAKVTSVAVGPAIGGPFQLTDASGRRVDQRLLLGKWSAVFFGYTACPDICPTTLAALGRASEALGPAAAHFQVVFVTVDPARDTPQRLRLYLSSASFPKGAVGLTGSAAEIAAAARAYHAFYRKVPEGPTYVIDHTAIVYLMDPRGRFVEPLDLGAPPPAVARRIEAAMDAV